MIAYAAAMLVAGDDLDIQAMSWTKVGMARLEIDANTGLSHIRHRCLLLDHGVMP